MKKVMALMLSVLMLMSVFAIPSSATTKADLLAMAKQSPVYKYLKAGIENAFNTVSISDEQAEQLKPLIEEFLKIVPSDKGPTVSSKQNPLEYSVEQVKAVYKLIYKACDIMGWTLKIVKKENSKFHEGDYIFYLYDNQNRLIFEYDGDYVTDTSGDVVAPSAVSTNAYLVGGGIFAAAAAALFVAFRKKDEECA